MAKSNNQQHGQKARWYRCPITGIQRADWGLTVEYALPHVMPTRAELDDIEREHGHDSRIAQHIKWIREGLDSPYDLNQPKWYLSPFEGRLNKIQEQLSDDIVSCMSLDQQALSENVDTVDIVADEGWKGTLNDSWLYLRDLRKAIEAGDFNAALNLSFVLGGSIKEYEFRKWFEDEIVVQYKVKRGAERGVYSKQLSSQRKSGAAIAELERRLTTGGRKSKSAHLLDMASEKDKSGKPRWGGIRKLKEYCRGVKSISKSNKAP